MNPKYCTVCNLLLDDVTRKNSQTGSLGLCPYLGCKRIENVCTGCVNELVPMHIAILAEKHPKIYQLWFDHQEIHRSVDLV